MAASDVGTVQERGTALPILITRVAICIFAVSQTMLSPLITQIGAAFGLGLGGSGFLFTAYYISNIFFCLVTGRIIAVIGKRTAMKAGLIFYALVTFAFAHTHSFAIACVFISCMGALATFIEAVGMDLVDDMSPVDAASNLTMTHGIAGIGMVGGVVYSGLMLNAGYDWRTIYTMMSVAVGAVAVVFCVVRFPKMHQSAAGGLAELKHWFTRRELYPTYLALFLYVGAEGAVTGWMATFMTTTLGYSSLLASLGTAAIWTVVTVGRIVCAGLVGTRYTVRALVSFLCTVCVIGVLLTAGVTMPILFWVALLLVGAGLSALWPLIASTALDAGNNGGTVMSLILFFGYFGAAVIPYLIGLIGDAAGLRMALIASAIVFAALGLVVRFVMPRSVSEKRTQG
ncbi:sugar MFS transporter [Butyricicoccus pullicaecorum]|uniref:MFS transporter n=1 Tax=Butyricicoccus pullicaecorum TaxID=501571 RepID=UPI0035221416